MRIAIIEDDAQQAELLKLHLTDANYDCHIFEGGQAALRTLQKESFDLLLIDWVLPDIPGDDVLRWAREHLDWRIPIVFVTHRDSPQELAYILDLGADDYLTKPIAPVELIARIRALLRRATNVDPKQKILKFAHHRFDLDRREAFVDGVPVSLTQKEFDLAAFLFRNTNRLLSRAHIMERVWGHSANVNTRTLDTHASRIRKKLNLNQHTGWRLSTVYHHGYRLEQVDEKTQNDD